MSKNTSLTRTQYVQKANQWIQQNAREWDHIRTTETHPYTRLQSILERQYGKPFWRWKSGRNKITGLMPTKSDPGVPFTLKDKGNGKVHFQADPERRANRGTQQRKQQTIIATQQDFEDFGRRNLYSQQEINDTYKRFKRRNFEQQASVTPGNHNDHVVPNNSAFNQPTQSYRNLTDAKTDVNLSKSDKMPTLNQMHKGGIPTSKQSLLRMEFNDVPPPSPQVLNQISTDVANDKTRITARQNNLRLQAAQARRLQKFPHILAYMDRAQKLGHIALGATALAVLNEALYGNAADAAQLAGEAAIDYFNPIDSGSVADGTHQGQARTQMMFDIQNGKGGEYFPNPNGFNGTY